MLEEPYQTVETRRRPFPWRTVAAVAFVAFALGAVTTMAIVYQGGAAWRKFASLAAGLALYLFYSWRSLRSQMRSWEYEYGKAVEYVARRKREQEGGLRFEAP